MKIIEQDILTVESGVIAHQVNLHGKMGAGIALKIAKKWPKVKNNYVQVAKNSRLGDVFFTFAMNGLIVANLFSQDRYGRDRRYTDYNALAKCLSTIYAYGENMDYPIYLPYGLGCGLAGGDWAIVSGLIDGQCPNAIVCRHDGR